MLDPALVPPLMFRRWTAEEDQILLSHVRIRGTRQWSLLSQSGLLPDRDNKACCNRYRILKAKLKEAANCQASAASLADPPSPLYTSTSTGSSSAVPEDAQATANNSSPVLLHREPTTTERLFSEQSTCNDLPRLNDIPETQHRLPPSFPDFPDGLPSLDDIFLQEQAPPPLGVGDVGQDSLAACGSHASEALPAGCPSPPTKGHAEQLLGSSLLVTPDSGFWNPECKAVDLWVGSLDSLDARASPPAPDQVWSGDVAPTWQMSKEVVIEVGSSGQPVCKYGNMSANVLASSSFNFDLQQISAEHSSPEQLSSTPVLQCKQESADGSRPFAFRGHIRPVQAPNSKALKPQNQHHVLAEPSAPSMALRMQIPQMQPWATPASSMSDLIIPPSEGNLAIARGSAIRGSSGFKQQQPEQQQQQQQLAELLHVSQNQNAMCAVGSQKNTVLPTERGTQAYTWSISHAAPAPNLWHPSGPPNALESRLPHMKRSWTGGASSLVTWTEPQGLTPPPGKSVHNSEPSCDSPHVELLMAGSRAGSMAEPALARQQQVWRQPPTQNCDSLAHLHVHLQKQLQALQATEGASRWAAGIEEASWLTTLESLKATATAQPQVHQGITRKRKHDDTPNCHSHDGYAVGPAEIQGDVALRQVPHKPILSWNWTNSIGCGIPGINPRTVKQERL